jgi:hypothetical protein
MLGDCECDTSGVLKYYNAVVEDRGEAFEEKEKYGGEMALRHLKHLRRR